MSVIDTTGCQNPKDKLTTENWVNRFGLITSILGMKSLEPHLKKVGFLYLYV